MKKLPLFLTLGAVAFMAACNPANSGSPANEEPTSDSSVIIETPEDTTAEAIESDSEGVEVSEEIPATSEFSEEIPSTSEFSEEIPSTSELSEEIPATSEFSEEIPSTSEFSEEIPSTSEFSEEIPSNEVAPELDAEAGSEAEGVILEEESAVIEEPSEEEAADADATIPLENVEEPAQ